MALPDDSALLFTTPLHRLSIPYMVVGSVASIAYGEIRTTRDVDIILSLSQADYRKIVAAFPLEDFYCPPVEVLGVETGRPFHGHFNLMHHASGYKADCYLADRDPWTRWAFQHRRESLFGETPVWLAPPEYVIVGKLRFYDEGRSEKHLRDIAAMLLVTDVDTALVSEEAARRGLTEHWLACQRRAG